MCTSYSSLKAVANGFYYKFEVSLRNTSNNAALVGVRRRLEVQPTNN
jgi:hypothetical protein